jgi:hypothetical protein
MRPRLANRPATAVGSRHHRLQLGEQVCDEWPQAFAVLRPRSGELHPCIGLGLVHTDGWGRARHGDDPPVIVVAAARQIHHIITIGAVRLDQGLERGK